MISRGYGLYNLFFIWPGSGTESAYIHMKTKYWFTDIQGFGHRFGEEQLCRAKMTTRQPEN